MAYKQITSIQTYELLEERLGISISNVGAWVQINDADSSYPFVLKVTAEITALNGGELADDIRIVLTGSDGHGVSICSEIHDFFKSKFFGKPLLLSYIR